MINETVEKIGFILMWVIIIAAALLFVSSIVACLIDEIKRIKENRITEKYYKSKGDPYRIKGDFYKLKGIDCQETDEKKRKLYEVMQNFKEFCKKYKIYFTIENFQWYIETQLTCYKYKEEEK